MDIDTLKALADERRLAIVELLSTRGELCVCELATALDMSDALVSHHTTKLREVGLVRTRRVGRWLHCSVDPQAISVLSTQLADVAGRADEASGSGCSCATASEDDQ